MTIEELPIMSCGIPLKSKKQLKKFQRQMLKAYDDIQNRLTKETYVDLCNYKINALQYGLNTSEFYTNMRRIHDKKTKYR